MHVLRNFRVFLGPGYVSSRSVEDSSNCSYSVLSPSDGGRCPVTLSKSQTRKARDDGKRSRAAQTHHRGCSPRRSRISFSSNYSTPRRRRPRSAPVPPWAAASMRELLGAYSLVTWRRRRQTLQTSRQIAADSRGAPPPRFEVNGRTRRAERLVFRSRATLETL